MPKNTRIDWRPLTQPYMHGVEAMLGNRKAEVVRCYEGEWATCHARDTRMIRRRSAQQPLCRAEARQVASACLHGDNEAEERPA